MQNANDHCSALKRPLKEALCTKNAAIILHKINKHQSAQLVRGQCLQDFQQLFELWGWHVPLGT
jgi:hypothetical protein